MAYIILLHCLLLESVEIQLKGFFAEHFGHKQAKRTNTNTTRTMRNTAPHVMRAMAAGVILNWLPLVVVSLFTEVSMMSLGNIERPFLSKVFLRAEFPFAL